MGSLDFDVLLIEDDLGDVELTETALSRSKLRVNLHVVNDGEEALAYLRQEGQYTKASRPSLILLDLNLPGLSGLEILSAIKSDQSLKSIPVVILTTSDTNTDILKSYENGVNCYVTKPIGLKEFIKIVNTIEDFWLTVVQLPTQRNN
ncbi:MAG: response regulator [Tolypothrix sp. T3-bin4]|nr:response regulator [Tolypothrix sp. T3-bin4]